jgi:fumarylacetoacetase
MSWIEYTAESDFPIENLPYGIFHLKTQPPSCARAGVAIGDWIVDLQVLTECNVFPESIKNSKCFSQTTLNDFMSLGRNVWREVRTILQALLRKGATDDAKDFVKKALVKQSEAAMLLPARVGDYTDFYSSRFHASNVGKIFRPNDPPLLPNWLWIPIGYHGRCSSIVISGTPVVRPCGQTKAPTADRPSFGPSKRLDFELEMATFVGPGNKLGVPIPIATAEDHIFGLVLMNDWSARDIQAWEYVPLGPFNGKNFATTISPWVVTLEALEPFRLRDMKQEPIPLPYLQEPEPTCHFDIILEVWLKTSKLTTPHLIARSNMKYLHWSIKQQLTHHASGGCNMQPGDLLGTGTISGPNPSEFGSLLELSWNGTKPLQLPNGETRSFLEDGDAVIFRGYAQGNGFRVGFGECSGTIVLSKSFKRFSMATKFD